MNYHKFQLCLLNYKNLHSVKQINKNEKYHNFKKNLKTDLSILDQNQ